MAAQQAPDAPMYGGYSRFEMELEVRRRRLRRGAPRRGPC